MLSSASLSTPRRATRLAATTTSALALMAAGPALARDGAPDRAPTDEAATNEAAAEVVVADGAAAPAPQRQDRPSPDASPSDASTGTPAGAIIVTGQRQTYAVTSVSETMIQRQSPLTSVNDVLNELPGVLVTNADNFGGADWLTTIFMRGFRSGSGANQIGTTIDGVPNGGSGYGGGSRANRYIDVLDLDTVVVSQGTADISSRSNEALGGTLNFVTRDPAYDRNLEMFAAIGDEDARKFYGRYDTGEIAPDTRAFVSASFSEAKDWIDRAATSRRDYALGKIVSRVADVDLTAYASWNKTDEHEYEDVSFADYQANPRQDALHMNWTGDPQVDQYYRDGWRAIRENVLTYLRAGRKTGDFQFEVTGYFHHMTGRGDWMPPYITDVTPDGAGNPESELQRGNTHYGPDWIEDFYYVNPDGSKAAPVNCPGLEDLPSERRCYAADARAVQSYRHSHYRNRRLGLTGDASYRFDLGPVGNTVRGGIWLEDGKSSVTRDWHRITDPAIGPAFDSDPYWVQYRNEFKVNEFMYYVEDVAEFGPVTVRGGIKQFFIDQTFTDVFPGDQRDFSQQSDVLPSVGVNYQAPIAGLELFAGWSTNFSAIENNRIASDAQELALLEPETAKNLEVGARFARGPVRAAITYYDIDFDNRIVFVASGAVTGIDYLEQVDGAYLNLGGLKSHGVEAIATVDVGGGLVLTGSYTHNNSEFTDVDEEAGVRPGEKMWGIPDDQFNLAADFTSGPLETGISLRYVGDRVINDDERNIAPSYIVSDFYLGARISDGGRYFKGLSARLNVNNLFDESYINGVFNGGGVFPGAPRTVTFGVTADF